MSCAAMNSLAGRFDGALDFYFWKGIPCVRLWPKKYAGIISKSQTASYKAFSAIGKMKTDIPPEIRENFKEWAAGSSWTWSDLFTSRAMEYWTATGELPPAISNPTITYGSGLKHIIMQTNTPQQPWVCRHVANKLFVSWKVYRGRKEICAKPSWGPGVDCFPMSLMYSSGKAFDPGLFGIERVADAYPGGGGTCEALRAHSVFNFGEKAESSGGATICAVSQGCTLPAFPNYYTYSVREHADYVAPEYHAGIHINRYCGISYKRRAWCTYGWPGQAWSISVFGNHYHYVTPHTPVTDTIVHGTALYPGQQYTINLFNPDHYAMPIYPTCETGIDPQEGRFEFSDPQLLIGERWWWEITFSPPYYRSWWLCYADPQGRLIPVYPISGQGKRPAPGYGVV